MSDLLSQMINLLSEEDKADFLALSERLKAVGGDIAKLAPDDLSLIQRMEQKYGEQINQVQSSQPEVLEDEDLLETPFAQYVRQVLARDLGQEFPQEEAAIAFVFENKWLPVDCQDDDLAKELFERYQQDIVELNQWRQSIVEVDKDPKMALGLAWFMVIFQLQKRFSQ